MMRLKRRSFLQAGAISSLAGLGRVVQPAWAEERLEFYPLWPEGSSNSRKGAVMSLTADGSAAHINKAGLYIMRPPTPNGAVMMIAGGGGYRHIELGREALPAARWLASLGITAVILLYRLPGEGWIEGAQAPFIDVQQALHMLRVGNMGLDIDPSRVGFMGFSAGGHLMGWGGLQKKAAITPAGLMLLYPIVSIAPPFTQSHTAHILSGRHPTFAQQQFYSLPHYVNASSAPLFLAYAEDDPIASPAQQDLLVRAYQAQHRPCEAHTFASGGHGFGMGRRHGPSHHWAGLALPWLRRNGFLQA